MGCEFSAARRRCVVRVMGAAMFLASALFIFAPAVAQSFPARPVVLVNPYPAGGGADITARALAKELADEWGQPVVVENRPGAGTTIAAAYVARASPDGYTLLLSGTQHAIASAIFSGLNYDYLTSFSPIAILSETPFFLVVRPESGIATVGDLMARLRREGNSMNYASSGPGSLPHLAGASLNMAAGSSAAHIPFSGTAPALVALLGGQVDFFFSDTSGLPNMKAGKVKAIATTASRRSPVLPNVPAMTETIKDFDMTGWTALEAPVGTPAAVIDRIHASVYRALRSPAMVRLFAETSRQIVEVSPAEFARFKQAEVLKYQRLTRAAKLKVE